MSFLLFFHARSGEYNACWDKKVQCEDNAEECSKRLVFIGRTFSITICVVGLPIVFSPSRPLQLDLEQRV